MRILYALAIVMYLTSCGSGGGGGSDSNYAGNIVVDLERDHIDSGDMNRISLEIVDINPQGSILKIRLSKSLQYAKGSAVLFPNRREERTITPDDRFATENERFLVFFLYPRDAISGDFMSISFNVKGITGDKNGFVEVDLDNNDPKIPDSREFDPAAPQFTAKERRSIYIEPDSTQPTPTPTSIETDSAAN